MMRALAGLVVAGPLQAVVIISLCTALSLMAPMTTSPLAYVATSLFAMLGYVGGAALALYVLHAGVRQGVVVFLGAAVVTTLLGQLLTHQGVTVLIGAMRAWVPVGIAATVLRTTRSLAMAMLALGGLAMVAVLGVYLVVGDPAPTWHQLLQGMVERVLTARPELKDISGTLSGVVDHMAPIMTGLLAAVLVLAALVCLMLGRWWQSLLVKPGALRTEFYALRLNAVLSLAGLAILGVASLKLGMLSSIAAQWALIVMVVFFFVGLAVLHATLANLKAAKFWLVAAYMLMGLSLQALMVVAVIGLLDPWLDLRRRSAGAGANRN
jgi:hypothetical protein